MQHFLTILIVRFFNRVIGGWYSDRTSGSLSKEEFDRLRTQKYPWYFEYLYILLALSFLTLAIVPWILFDFPLLESESFLGVNLYNQNGSLSGAISIIIVILMPLLTALTLAGCLITLVCMALPFKSFRDYMLYMQAKSGWRLTWSGTIKLEVMALFILVLLTGVLLAITRFVLL